MQTDVYKAVSHIKKYLKINPLIAVILGSGLGGFADSLVGKVKIPTTDIPGFKKSTVYGHYGFIVLGSYNSSPLIALQGRTHYYEGYMQNEITYAIRLFRALDVKVVIVTNAAGAINRRLKPGDLMLITDHIHFMFSSPLLGNAENDYPRFPDMSNAYPKDYHSLVESVAIERRMPLKRGVLWTTAGPTYETAAEIRMIEKMGGDAGSMSTTPEVIESARLGLPVIGISCITNYATGVTKQKLSHDDVTQTAETVRDSFTSLLTGILDKLRDRLL